ncbi:type I 3-dehydroquinate dehydratase [Brevibacterium sp. 5221]|uniref:3-dehydroquinate dehydratase n=1 Tax=Brevibacterium rongguiense TaxID=2695267 RepID=A0A6N9H874_9MICO|nr:type I 3-dehydroquinate dehydratase [Brevibacterium rongguiense]MYM20258.1 type I 3-dehydroquinate dehydratase [Brevibacterium rongguiense]
MRPLPFAGRSGRPAIIAPLQPRSIDELAALLPGLEAAAGADALEWRLDALAALRLGGAAGGPEHRAVEQRAPQVHTVEAPTSEPHEPRAGDEEASRSAALEAASAGLALLRERCGLPVMLTVRTHSEGGMAQLDDAAYALLVEGLVALGPDAVDIEFRRADAARLLARAREAGVGGVASFHDFARTPPAERLVELCAAMEGAGADVAKFAVMPRSRSDVLAVLAALDRARTRVGVPVIGISMSELGRATRLIGGDFGSAATFAALVGASAPGQLSAAQVGAVLDILGETEPPAAPPTN